MMISGLYMLKFNIPLINSMFLKRSKKKKIILSMYVDLYYKEFRLIAFFLALLIDIVSASKI